MFSTDNNSLDEPMVLVPDTIQQVKYEITTEPHLTPLILRDSSISSLQDEEYQCDVYCFNLKVVHFSKQPEFKCKWIVCENDLIRKTKENILEQLKKSDSSYKDLSVGVYRLRKLSNKMVPQDVLIDDQVFGRYMELFSNKDNLVLEEICDTTMNVTENDGIILFVKHCLPNCELEELELEQVVIKKRNMNLTGVLSSFSEIPEQNIEFSRGMFSYFPESLDTLERLIWCSSLYELTQTTGEPSSGALVYYRDGTKSNV